MIEANNIIIERRVAIVVVHLRDVIVEWYKSDKANINQYVNKISESFIRRIKVRFTSNI